MTEQRERIITSVEFVNIYCNTCPNLCELENGTTFCRKYSKSHDMLIQHILYVRRFTNNLSKEAFCLHNPNREVKESDPGYFKMYKNQTTKK